MVAEYVNEGTKTKLMEGSAWEPRPQHQRCPADRMPSSPYFPFSVGSPTLMASATPSLRRDLNPWLATPDTHASSRLNLLWPLGLGSSARTAAPQTQSPDLP